MSTSSNAVFGVTTVLLLVVSADAQQLLFPGSEWETAEPASVWMDENKLRSAVGVLENPGETMVIQNGRVVWQGDNVNSQQHVFSVTKTFASTAMGLLIDDGKVTLDTRVSEFVPSMKTDYPDATLRHFVTQTSGYVADGEPIPLSLPTPDDVYAPGTPLFTPSGSQYAYTGAAMDMFAYSLSLAADKPLQDLFTNRIADPIQMDPNTWDWRGFETQDGVHVDGGSGYPDRGVSISAANAARLGLLFLARGNWDGEQLLSSEWIDSATQLQVPAKLPRHPQSVLSGSGVYGYGWWIGQEGWYEAIGFQNNYLSVNPGTGTVIVSLGTESGGNNNIDTFKARVQGALLPSVWDGLGDGRWDEFNVATGKPRWQTEGGLLGDVVPSADNIIRHDTVTVDSYLRTHDITLEDGARLHIAADSDFGSDGRIELQQSSMIVNGVTEVTSIKLEDASSLVVDGGFSVGRLDAADSILTVHDTDEPISARFRFSLTGDSELEFVLSDGDWGSTIDLASGRLRPRFSGIMRLDLAPELDPQLLTGTTISLFDWLEASAPTTEFADVVSPNRIKLDLSQLYTNGDVTVESVLGKPTSAGDFNGDSVLDVFDIDSLSTQIRVESSDLYFDLDQDERVTNSDLIALVEEVIGTTVGDIDLNGRTDFADFLVLSANFGLAGGWSQGDLDANGEIGFSDFLALSANFGDADEPAVSVPEPCCLPLWLLLFSWLRTFRCRRKAV